MGSHNQRDDMLAKVDALYKGRTTGDTSAFDVVLAEGATFKYEGEDSLIAAFPGGRADDPREVAQALFDQIDMTDRKCVQTFVEGDNLAVLWETELCVKGREPFRQMLFDIWEFNEAGKITRGTQYQDTAKIIEEVKAGGFDNRG